MKTLPRFKDLPRRYDELVDILPPRPIHTESEYDEVQEMIDAMAGHPLNPDQADYLDALTTFFAAYEDEHHAIDTSDLSGLDMLKFLMEQRSMTASDLGRILGDRSLGSRVLRGERALSKTHIRALCDHFCTSPDVFFG